MTSPDTLYKELYSKYSHSLKKLRSQRNWLTIIKIIVFMFFCYGVFEWIRSTDGLWGFVAIPSIIIFILLNKVESGILSKLTSHESIISCIEDEQKYLVGDFSAFDQGKEFFNEEHPFAKDLDIFGKESIFQAVNRAETPNGRKITAERILYPDLHKDAVIETQNASSELAEDIEFCLLLRSTIKSHPVSKVDENSIEEWKKSPEFLKSKFFKACVYIINILFCALVITSFFIGGLIDVIVYAFIIQLCIAQFLTSRINKSMAWLDIFIKGFGNYLYPIRLIASRDFRSKDLISIKQKLSINNNDAIKEFGSLKSILEALHNRANLLSMVMLNGAFMRDIHTMMRLDRWKRRNIDAIGEWQSAVSSMEMLNSFAIYRFNNPAFTYPEIDDTVILEAKEMSHPLMFFRDPVSNDMSIKSLHELFIITGANMSGKSTFLRAIGANWVLASCGCPVSSSSFRFTPMKLFSSMRTSDNLSSGTSYFHVEILRLRALISAAETGEPMFIILDEILKGTNSQDKLNGSRRFILKLITLPLSGVIATHDLELGELESAYPENIYNRCFEVEYKDDDLSYDYKLRKGVSQNMNASFLLEKFGLV